MNINELTKNPALLFKESFVPVELKVPLSWEEELKKIISFCREKSFSSSLELLDLIETPSQATFLSNKNHFIFTPPNKKPIYSELLGSLLMYLIWFDIKKTLPKIILSSEQYFFLTPNNDVIQINSNKKNTLPTSKKFNLFNSDKIVQLNFVDLVKHYFEKLCSQHIENKNYQSLQKAQTYMIFFDPKEIKWYARRGLLLKRLGDFSGALSDLKRFLSFCAYEDAPMVVKNAIIELEGLNATNNFSEYSIH